MNDGNSSAGGWILGILIVGILIAVVWAAYREHQKTPTPIHAQATAPTEIIELTLHLPSLQPEFQFACDMRIRYRIDRPLHDSEEAHRLAEKAVYDAASNVSARFQLDNQDVFEVELNEEVQQSRSAANGRMTVSAHCSAVTVNDNDLALVREVVRRKFELLAENHLWDAYRTRIEQLRTIFSEPKTAALWWLAKHPEGIDQMPDKFRLMHTIKRYLDDEGSLGGPYKFTESNPDGHPPAADLDDFLASADESDRAAMGSLLANVYERLGKEALAERARKLAEPDMSDSEEK